MSLITLTTDFGLKDYFVGAVKGAIYSELPEAIIVDISHDISPFNIAETAYVVRNAYKSFPEGSVHIIGVDSELNEETNHIALKLDGHYFICPNNGIISIIASEFKPEKIVEINIHDRVESSFPVLDVFVKVACHIIRGGSLDLIGKEITDYKKLTNIQPITSADSTKINGCVIYIDNYGNIITNITRKTFETIRKGRDFEMKIGHYTLTEIYDKYSDVVNFSLPPNQRYQDGKKLAIFNSAGFIEIAIYRSNMKTVGGAANLLGLQYRDQLTISFK